MREGGQKKWCYRKEDKLPTYTQRLIHTKKQARTLPVLAVIYLAEECAAAVIAGSTRDTQTLTHLGAQLKHDNKVEQRRKGEKKLPAKGYSEASLQDGQQNLKALHLVNYA